MGIHHVLDPVRDGIFWDFSDAASGSVACKKAADIGIIPMSVNRFSLCFDCPVHGIRRLYQVALWLRQRLQRHLAGAVGACRSVIGFWGRAVACGAGPGAGAQRRAFALGLC